LGSRHWCGLVDEDESNLPEIVFQRGASQPFVFRFEDQLRPDAKAVVDGLISRGIQVEILSGDREAPVAHVAKALGIQHYQAKATPQVKLAYVEGLARAGRKVLMVGDGLNDAPALAAGFTSMAPSSASDIGRTTADSVFMGESLLPVLVAQDAAVKAQRLAKQNFGLAIAYNLFAIPVAVLGFASPFFAAIAMSTSSILVVSNALRLSFMLGRRVEMRGVLSKEAEMKTQTKMEKAA
jgi:Cu2+-exporting ATPase